MTQKQFSYVYIYDFRYNFRFCVDSGNYVYVIMYFSAKKKTLKAGINKSKNKSKNKQLSSFAYSKIIELIRARAEDNFIEVREINPAYTSMIGNIKYSERSRIAVIARIKIFFIKTDDFKLMMP